MEALLPRRVKELCGGEHCVALHLLDTGAVHGAGADSQVTSLFTRGLQQPRGGVLPLASLPLPPRQWEAQTTSTSLPLLPSLSTSTSSPSLEGYMAQGVVATSTFPTSLTYTSTTTLWAGEEHASPLASLLSYLTSSDSVVVYQHSSTHLLALLAPLSPSSALLSLLPRLDS